MKIGFVGLGKLGLPVSVCMAKKGHDVIGYDVDSLKLKEINEGVTYLHEPELRQDLRYVLEEGLYRVTDDLGKAVSESEIIFVAVQTPSLFSGKFETNYLRHAVRCVAEASGKAFKVISVISTILPGTIRNELYPLVEGKNLGLIYNASFIAMGTVMQDFQDPEFVLIGEKEKKAGDKLVKFYRTILPLKTLPTPIFRLTWEEAEIVKLSYNTFIGFKIVTANTIMEICDKIGGANCDRVTEALSAATRRIVGPHYLRGGMGDGGPCHPRDQDALSYLAIQMQLSTSPFSYVMEARLHQTRWLGEKALKTGLPIVILGKRFKPNTNLTDYSPSILLSDLLRGARVPHEIYDPMLDPPKEFNEPKCFVATLQTEDLQKFPYPKGSVVLDVWRFLEPREDVKIIRVGDSSS